MNMIISAFSKNYRESFLSVRSFVQGFLNILFAHITYRAELLVFYAR